nr:hypothetical protein [uncultured Acetatifactor sp.]
MNAAKELGYRQVYERWDMQFDFEGRLDYPLPESGHRLSFCCWKK